VAPAQRASIPATARKPSPAVLEAIFIELLAAPVSAAIDVPFLPAAPVAARLFLPAETEVEPGARSEETRLFRAVVVAAAAVVREAIDEPRIWAETSGASCPVMPVRLHRVQSTISALVNEREIAKGFT
jgi:hypothetical protein